MEHQLSSEDPKKDEQKLERKLRPVGFFSLFKYSSCRDKILIAVGTVMAIVTGAALPAEYIIYGKYIDSLLIYDASNRNLTNETMTTDQFLHSTGNLCAFYAAVGVASMLSNYIMVSCFCLAAANQAFKIKNMFMASILKQDIGWYDTTETGDFASRITGDLTKIQNGIGEKVCIFISLITSIIIIVVTSLFNSWKLTLVSICYTPLTSLSTTVMSKIQSSVSREEMQVYGAAGAVAEEVISSIRTVAAYGGEKKEIQRYETCLVPACKKGIKRGFITALSDCVTSIFSKLGFALAFWYGVKLIIADELTAGQIIAMIVNNFVATVLLSMLSPFFEAFAEAKGAAAKIYNIIQRVPSIDSSSKEGKKPHSVKGEIRIRDVYFNYPARPTVPILKGVSLDVRPGERVALVGPSGCGKSTIIQLIQRFYDAPEGAVFVDKNNVKDLNVGWLRGQIGLVGQEPVLFSMTIAENIRHGKSSATQEEIENAANTANIHNFIQALPLKYNTMIGERGTQLSGGQKQRIAIARALVKNPRILLLDEATSALDTENESLVQAALDNASQSRTTVVVAHRLSTIRTADKIVVLSEGKVKEVGTHDKLMEKQGIYFNLVKTQTKSSKKENVEEKLDEREEYLMSTLGRKMSAQSRSSVGHAARQLELQSVPSLFCPYSQMSLNSAAEDGSESKSSKKENVEEKLDEKEEYLMSELGRKMSALSRSSVGHATRQLELQIESSFGSRSNYSQMPLNSAKEDGSEENMPRARGRLWKLSAKEWPYALFGGISSLLMAILIVAQPIIYGNFLGVLSDEHEKLKKETDVFCIVVVVIALTHSLFSFLQVFMFTVVGERTTSKLRKMLFSNIIAQDIEFFDHPKNSVGSLCTRLTSDAANVQGATGYMLSTLLQAALSLLAVIAMAFWFDYKIGLLVLAFVPCIWLGAQLGNRVVKEQDTDEKLGEEQASKVAIEAIENIRTVASLHQEETIFIKFKNHLQGPHKQSRKQSQVRGIAYGLAQGFLKGIFIAAIMFVGSRLIANKELQNTDLLIVIQSILAFSMVILEAVSFVPEYHKAKVAAERIFQFLDIKPKIDAFSLSGKRLGDVNGHIRFRNVDFTYSTRPNVKILRGLNLKIEPGKTVALLGSSGCGKSTCVQLIERFYEPQSGSVLLDNTDVCKMNVSNLRSHVGLVSQEPVLFSYSIAENIAYGDNSRHVQMHEIIEAAQKANIHNFIITLPQGYETPVGDRGTQLSGGQKQRIAIARALLRNPKILVLDEATSALDAESEQIVQDALDKARSGRTCLIIAHRLASVQNADAIMVMHEGRVVEAGTHEELLNKKGLYYNMHNTQSF